MVIEHCLQKLADIAVNIHAEIEAPDLDQLEHVELGSIEHDILQSLCGLLPVLAQLIEAFLADLRDLLPKLVTSIQLDRLTFVTNTLTQIFLLEVSQRFEVVHDVFLKFVQALLVCVLELVLLLGLLSDNASVIEKL